MKNLLMTSIAIFGITIISIAQLPSNIPANGLVAFYPLDGNGNDLSGNNNNLNSNGNIAYISNSNGTINSACHFANGNDYYTTPTSSWSLINNFPQGSISFWVKIDSQYVSGHYFGIGNSFIVKQKHLVGEDLFFGMQDGTTKIRMQLTGVFPTPEGTDIIGNTSLIPNFWYHVVGTWNGVKHSLYVNGIIDGQISNSNGISDQPLPDYFSIGSLLYGGNGTISYPSGAYGAMDDIGIWNRALTQEEITSLNIGSSLGSNELSQSNLFSVFPNPAQSVINVNIDDKLVGSVFTIYDNIGKAVKTGKLNSSNTTIELNDLSGGIYTFNVGGNSSQTFKIIKE